MADYPNSLIDSSELEEVRGLVETMIASKMTES